MTRPSRHRGTTSHSCVDTIGRVFKSPKLRKSSFYLLLLFLAILTCVDIFKLVREYLEDNVDTDMYIEFNDTITMPNVTFCMARQHAWSHFNLRSLKSASEVDDVVDAGLKNMTDRESFLKQGWDWRMVIDAYMVVETLNSLERETGAQGALLSILKLAKEPRLASKRASIKKWLGAIVERNVSFDEFQQKVGDETLKRSLQRFQRLSTNEQGRQLRNSLKITWLSQRQLCFQPNFDQDNFKPIEEQDKFFTLSLAHNTENVEWIDCMSVDMHGRPSEEARELEGKGRAKDGLFSDLCIGDMHEVEVEIRTIYTSLPGVEEEEKRCTIYEDGHTELECRSRCRLELIRKACSCTPLTLGYLVTDDKEMKQFPNCDYTQCDPQSLIPNVSHWDTTCGAKCYPDCTQVRYELKTFKKTSPRKELLQVTLFWGSFEYLRYIQKEKWSFNKFFSNLGGSIGIWLGLSVLSVIQFITFLLTRAHKRVKRVEAGHDRHHSRASDVSGSSHSTNPLGGGISMNPFGGKKEKP